jgi:hypothetical protein
LLKQSIRAEIETSANPIWPLPNLSFQRYAVTSSTRYDPRYLSAVISEFLMAN